MVVIDMKLQQQKIISSYINKEQARDTGMAMVLICLLFTLFLHNRFFINLAIPLLIITMIFPELFRPLAKIWYGLAQVLGTIMSKVLLVIIFFLIVTPVGLCRRALGSDVLQLKKWKKDNSSVFKLHEHIFRPEDIEKPY